MASRCLEDEAIHNTADHIAVAGTSVIGCTILIKDDRARCGQQGGKDSGGVAGGAASRAACKQKRQIDGEGAHDRSHPEHRGSPERHPRRREHERITGGADRHVEARPIARGSVSGRRERPGVARPPRVRGKRLVVPDHPARKELCSVQIAVGVRSSRNEGAPGDSDGECGGRRDQGRFRSVPLDDAPPPFEGVPDSGRSAGECGNCQDKCGNCRAVGIVGTDEESADLGRAPAAHRDDRRGEPQQRRSREETPDDPRMDANHACGRPAIRWRKRRRTAGSLVRSPPTAYASR